MQRAIIPAALLAAILALGGCGPSPPTDKFNANLDGDCDPSDIVDLIRSWITPTTFWGEQVADFQSYAKSARIFGKISNELMQDNRTGRAQFRQIVAKRGRELGLKGSSLNKMIQENMADFDASTKRYNQNVFKKRQELEWANRCLQRAKRELRD